MTIDLTATLKAVDQQCTKYKRPARVGDIQRPLRTPDREGVWHVIQDALTQGMLNYSKNKQGSAITLSEEGRRYLDDHQAGN